MYTAPYTDTECRLAAGLSHAKEIHTTTFDSLGVDLAAVPAAPLRKPILAVLHLPLETQPATWRNFQGLSRLRRIRILPPPPAFTHHLAASCVSPSDGVPWLRCRFA